MKIVHGYPPVWKQVLAANMSPNPEKVIFTYGDIIYVPSGQEVPDHLLEHERTHSEQQGDDPKGWWEKYLHDKDFRLNQEVEAYAMQYDFICLRVKDRNQRHRVLLDLAGIFSSATYGAVVGRTDAMNMIKSAAKTKK